MSRFRAILIVAASTLAAIVAGLAFWVSFEAISAYAVQIGALPKSLRYCAPLLVDSFTMLGTAFLLWLALSGEKLREVWDAYYAWALIIAATAASAYLNAAHVAPGSPDEARWVAGAVPVTLLASVHLLVLLLLRLLAWTPTSEAARKPALGNPPTGVGERGSGPTTRTPAPRRQAAARAPGVAPTTPGAPRDLDTERARIAREQYQEHPSLSGRELAEAWRKAGVGASNGRAYETLRELKAGSNGSAPRVGAEA